jgi:antitoxin component YwqK of YwqJK toxin-antitoxin module
VQLGLKKFVLVYMFKKNFVHMPNSSSICKAMQKYLLLFIIGFLGLVIQAQKRVFFDKLENRNEIYYYENQPFTGVSLQRHDSTKKKMLEINWRNGLPHGTKTTWYPNEKLKSTVEFSDGIKNGPFVYYWQNGKLKEKGNYINGELDGLHEAYYENGNPRMKYNYAKGKQEGLNELFYNNGNKEQSAFIKNGALDGVFKAWYPNGLPLKEIHYKNGIKHGVEKTWHTDGTIAQEGSYKEGKKDGIHTSYEIFVKSPLKKESYNNGKKEGTWITFGQEGDTALLATYQNDALHGPYMEKYKGELENIGVYRNGKKHGYWKQSMASKLGPQEGEYNNGNRIGKWILYDNRGKILARLVFDSSGELIEEDWSGK